MNNKEIIDFLKENGIEDIEEIKYKDEITVLRFFYDFDDEELEAAKAYSNDESEEDEESDLWYDEFFLPYLNDLAVDNVGELLENAIEELNIGIQFISYSVEKDNVDYSEFIAVFHNKDENVEIEKILDELKI